MIVKKFAGVEKDATECRILVFGGNKAFGGFVPFTETLDHNRIFDEVFGGSVGELVRHFRGNRRVPAGRDKISPIFVFFADIESTSEKHERADQQRYLLHFDRSRDPPAPRPAWRFLFGQSRRIRSGGLRFRRGRGFGEFLIGGGLEVHWT